MTLAFGFNCLHHCNNISGALHSLSLLLGPNAASYEHVYRYIFKNVQKMHVYPLKSHLLPYRCSCFYHAIFEI